MRASLEHEEVEVVAVNDPFIDLEYMVSNIPRVCVYLNICDKKNVISSVSWFACKYRIVFAVLLLFKTLPVICFDFDIELDKNKHKQLNLFSL